MAEPSPVGEIVMGVVTVGVVGSWLGGKIAERSSATIDNSSPTIHPGKQGKHVPGHNNFIPGRSELTHPDPQGLLDDYAGTGERKGNTEYVDFDQVIGNVVDPETGEATPTTRGKIHYDEKGNAHIVPTAPEAPSDTKEGQDASKDTKDGNDNSSNE